MSKLNLLMGASALVAAATSFAPASAAVTAQVYGGGSSLIAPYLRQAEDCYGNPTPLVIKGSTLNNPTYASPPVPFFNYTGRRAQNCATKHVDPTFQLNYISTGSGTGLKGWFSHDAATYWGDTVPPGGNNTPYPSVDYANAETAIQAADVAAYNNTGGGCQQPPATGGTAGPSFGPSGCSYNTPAVLYGPMIQVPLLITPVDMAYDSVYKRVRNADGSVTSYHFNVHNPRPDGSGGLVLDAATYCKIFNGEITDWNQIPTSLNGGVSLRDPADSGSFSVPLVMVGRSDSSGTSSVFTRHLAAQCPNFLTGTNYFPDFTSTISNPPSSAIYTGTWNGVTNFGGGDNITDVPGKYTGANGSSKVAAYIYFDPNNQPGPNTGDSVEQGRIGYIGPDYVLPTAVQDTYGLQSASLLRPGNATPVSPTAANVTLAFKNRNGTAILPPSGAAASSDPTNWVQSPHLTAAIAIPGDLKAYPIIGTSNLLSYTCYANASVTTKWAAFITWYETSKTVTDAKKGLLASAGFAPMPDAWQDAIVATFSKPTSTTMPYDLYISQAGGSAPQCSAVSPGA